MRQTQIKYILNYNGPVMVGNAQGMAEELRKKDSRDVTTKVMCDFQQDPFVRKNIIGTIRN